MSTGSGFPTELIKEISSSRVILTHLSSTRIQIQFDLAYFSTVVVMELLANEFFGGIFFLWGGDNVGQVNSQKKLLYFLSATSH